MDEGIFYLIVAAFGIWIHYGLKAFDRAVMRFRMRREKRRW
ncbi:hypothetical protein [Hydrogenimonas sp.]